jgi:CRP/FNR family transcriptional regulator
MQHCHQAECDERVASPAEIVRKFGWAQPADDKTPWTLATGSSLFRPGDARRVYRIERGAVCHYMRWGDGRHEVLEFAFPGDIVGLGHLATHVSTAQAMVATTVRIVDEAELARELESNSSLSFKLAAAGEREFDFLRSKALSVSLRGPIQRLANYLLAISSMAEERSIVTSEVSSGVVAERLNMSIDMLSLALLSLQKSGLVEPVAGRLKILDVRALETVADTA